MSIAACQELVKTLDPDRYKATMTAPEGARGALLALYAFNLEVANAAWSATDPQLSQIRLQYWRDQIEALFQGKTIDALPTLHALRTADRINDLPQACFLKIINARQWDAYSEPFENQDDLYAYLMDTSGTLMAMAAHILGLKPLAENPVRDFGYAAGLAAFFAAVPELKARGRHPLPDESDTAIRALAKDALGKIQSTRGEKSMRKVLPALLSASEAVPILRNVVKDPSRVLKGTLVRAPIRKAWRLLWLESMGIW